MAHDISGLVLCPIKKEESTETTDRRLGVFEVAREVRPDLDEDGDLIPVEIPDFESTNAATFYEDVYRSRQTLVLV